MRQSQQKNRMRGRGRKGPNPMNRSYESNGPDVKIRGTAAHVAEKYASLARDALSMGDNVMAENYFQHAEHYNRIIAAAAAQQASRNEENSPNYGRGPQPDFNNDDDDDSAGEERAAQPERAARQDKPERAKAKPAEADDAEAGEETAEARPPRGEGRARRRPRRETAKAEKSEGGEAAGVNGNGAHAANGKNGDGDKRDISNDASMLPDSILGAGSPQAEAGAED